MRFPRVVTGRFSSSARKSVRVAACDMGTQTLRTPRGVPSRLQRAHHVGGWGSEGEWGVGGGGGGGGGAEGRKYIEERGRKEEKRTSARRRFCARLV